jgi:hypothetical protein
MRQLRVQQPRFQRDTARVSERDNIDRSTEERLQSLEDELARMKQMLEKFTEGPQSEPFAMGDPCVAVGSVEFTRGCLGRTGIGCVAGGIL